ncbi:MAG: Phormidium phage MIS-PhV1A [Cyanobacteriota bacterium]|jgi:N6-adenosine-specific RNA methylase IME4
MVSKTYKKSDKVGQLKLTIATSILPNLPQINMGQYSLIVIDPPWAYNLRETDKSHRGRCPYPSMSDQQILDMPIGAIAASEAYLFLWSTNAHLPLAFQCLKQWGFEYKSLFTWVKVTKDSKSPNFVENEDQNLLVYPPPKLRIGLGHNGRNATEQLLFGIKGKALSLKTLGFTNISNVIFAPLGQHSEKPQLFWETLAYPLAEKLGGNSIELFARQRREGWDSWGSLELEQH